MKRSNMLASTSCSRSDAGPTRSSPSAGCSPTTSVGSCRCSPQCPNRKPAPPRTARWRFETPGTLSQSLVRRAARAVRPQRSVTLRMNANHNTSSASFAATAERYAAARLRQRRIGLDAPTHLPGRTQGHLHHPHHGSATSCARCPDCLGHSTPPVQRRAFPLDTQPDVVVQTRCLVRAHAMAQDHRAQRGRLL